MLAIHAGDRRADAVGIDWLHESRLFSVKMIHEENLISFRLEDTIKRFMNGLIPFETTFTVNHLDWLGNSDELTVMKGLNTWPRGLLTIVLLSMWCKHGDNVFTALFRHCCVLCYDVSLINSIYESLEYVLWSYANRMYFAMQ